MQRRRTANYDQERSQYYLDVCCINSVEISSSQGRSEETHVRIDCLFEEPETATEVD